MEIGRHVKEEDRDQELELLIEGTLWPEMNKETKLRCLAYLVGVLHYSAEKCAKMLDGKESTVKQYISELRRDGRLEKIALKERRPTGIVRMPEFSSTKRAEPKLSPREEDLLQKAAPRKRV